MPSLIVSLKSTNQSAGQGKIKLSKDSSPELKNKDVFSYHLHICVDQSKFLILNCHKQEHTVFTFEMSININFT